MVTHAQLTTLLGLGVVLVVALGGVLLLLRSGRQPEPNRSGIVAGYPPSLYPAQDLTTRGALAALAATQARLLALYEQVPAHSDLAIWLRTFLHELREIMDTAYRVAMIGRLYGQPLQLERLVAEVQQIESTLADHVVRRLLARDGDREQELLEGRLETLRLCVRELRAGDSAQPASA